MPREIKQMRLMLATKQYVKANESKGAAQLMSAAEKAINSGRPEWEMLMAAILSSVIEDFGNDIAEDLGGKPKYSPLIIICPECGCERLDIDGDYYVCIDCKKRFIPDPMETKWEFDPATVAIRRWIIKHGTEDITSILSTNLKDVKTVILAGVDENLSNPQIAINLRKFYVDRSPFKAMRVARTEVCKASGFGNLEAARQSGVAKKKTWLSSRDDRVRDAHVVMDGETVDLNEDFSNGLQHPSEPMCRCALTFKSGR